jgi:TorA maturation chaperone TorD
MRVTTIVLAGLAVQAAAGAPLIAQGTSPLPLATAVAGVAPLLLFRYDDGAIRSAFQSVLNRDPTNSELRRYRAFMDEYDWTEQDIRRDLRDRPDYQRYSSNHRMQPETIIRRAYRDILGRDPDTEGLRTYRSKMIDQGWSEQDVRESLRSSPEYTSGTVRNASADRIIRRAYQDILNREPDSAGLETYRRNIVERGWDEQDVRTALRRSSEAHGQGSVPGGVSGSSGGHVSTMTEAQANDIVRRAYQSVLRREPDADGMRDYTFKVMHDHWTQSQVMDALRKSPEYRSKH